MLQMVSESAQGRSASQPVSILPTVLATPMTERMSAAWSAENSIIKRPEKEISQERIKKSNRFIPLTGCCPVSWNTCPKSLPPSPCPPTTFEYLKHQRDKLQRETVKIFKMIPLRGGFLQEKYFSYLCQWKETQLICSVSAFPMPI